VKTGLGTDVPWWALDLTQSNRLFNDFFQLFWFCIAEWEGTAVLGRRNDDSPIYIYIEHICCDLCTDGCDGCVICGPVIGCHCLAYK
jgi:hypothetical protein